MNTPLDQIPSYVAMQRAAIDGFMAGIGLALDAGKGPDLVTPVLGQDPVALNERILSLSQIALGLLPIGALSPMQKAVYGRQEHDDLITLVDNVTDAMQLVVPSIMTFDVQPARLLELVKQKGAYGAFKLLGEQMTNSGMDQRAVAGAFMGFAIDQVVGALDRRLHDDKVPLAERNRLLEDFAPALMALDDVLRLPVARKQDMAVRRQDLKGQVQEAQADQALADTLLKLRQNIVAPREELFAAAKRQMAKQGGTPAADGGQKPLPPPSGTRRIV